MKGEDPERPMHEVATGNKGPCGSIWSWVVPVLRRRMGVQILLCVLICAAVTMTSAHYGAAWDEGCYYWPGLSHAVWLQRPSWDGIDAAWSPNHEHPPLVKLLGGVSRIVLFRILGLLEPFHAFRAMTCAFICISVFGLYGLGTAAMGPWAGAISVLIFFAMPRVFYHAHLAALDFPLAAVWVFATYAFWLGMRERKWIPLAAVSLGIGLLTKLPIVFLWAALTAGFAGRWLCAMRMPHTESARVRNAALQGVAILICVPLVVLIAGWPWLWKNPPARLWGYFMRGVEVRASGTMYFGQVGMPTPWHYPFVMSAITIPALTLVLAVIGGVLSRPRERHIAPYVLGSALLPLLVFAFVSSLRQDGVRYLLPSYPFVAVLAAMGLCWIVAQMRTFWLKVAAIVTLVALGAGTVYSSVAAYHPYEVAYYNELIGGIRGAERHGFEVEYWGSSFAGARPWLMAHSDARYWVPIASGAFTLNAQMGIFPEDIRVVRTEDECDYLVLLCRKGGFSARLWQYYLDETPVYSVQTHGVALVNLYAVNRAGSGADADRRTLWRHVDLPLARR